MAYTIKQNILTGGRFCIFKIGEQNYFADMSEIPIMSSFKYEVMIFKCDIEGIIHDWRENYCRRYNTYKDENLIESIEDFIKQKTNENN